MRDIAAFGRVISTGLVVAGYAFLGAWLSGWLQERGYPSWVSFGALTGVCVFGLWQGWLFLTRPTRLEKKRRSEHQPQRGV